MTSPGSGTSGEARHGHKHGHDDDASYEPLPPVERLRPGMTSVARCRCPTTRCATCSSTCSRATDGVYLVDAGWNTDEAYQALDRPASPQLGYGDGRRAGA